MTPHDTPGLEGSDPLRAPTRKTIAFPSGDDEFLHDFRQLTDRYLTCSLFSPMGGFHQPVAGGGRGAADRGRAVHARKPGRSRPRRQHPRHARLICAANRLQQRHRHRPNRRTPTDHLFAPGVALLQALASLPAALHHRAAWVIALHDPCILVTILEACRA